MIACLKWSATGTTRCASRRWPARATELRSDDTPLFHADGFIERRADSISDDIADFAASAVPADPDLDAYVARILAGAASDTGDDACLMAVRIR